MTGDTTAPAEGDTDRSLGTRVREELLPVLSDARFWFALGAAVAIVLLVIGAILAFASGPLPTWIRQQITSLVPSLSITVTQALLAGLLGGTGILFLRYGATMDRSAGFLVDNETPVEAPATAPRVIGDEFDRDLAAALDEVRLKRVAHRSTTPHRTLRELAVRITELGENCSTTTATQTIDNGAWTNDPIARAFCSERIAYPVTFRMVQWARPDIAYDRAVTQTSAAVARHAQTALGRGEVPESPPEDEYNQSPDWLVRIVNGVLGEPNTAISDPEDEPGTPQEADGSLSQATGGND
ncbi:hypothetical protein OB955_20020 [Halobacteria archaeon AArc-m2/3/4]|uniref:DUF4129 domain-containing protein n=1 Tax=Natronoglomus mannanivorans TaxID=2979990 RepID=A0ABT2QJG9_9EURY|nr:hypothetical protein [Halobacteria archaeon AArc-m2/3/4]